MHPLTPEADAAATTLFQLLDEFLEVRDRSDGPLKIYGAFQTWLNAQSWCCSDPLLPDQANDDGTACADSLRGPRLHEESVVVGGPSPARPG
ncbi:hypothetical protein GCM10010245_57930 [Streptomyces spectabilis]|nr:hypothetical protein GCM10010245_57930 [Streptomyces spectabilis]